MTTQQLTAKPTRSYMAPASTTTVTPSAPMPTTTATIITSSAPTPTTTVTTSPTSMPLKPFETLERVPSSPTGAELDEINFVDRRADPAIRIQQLSKRYAQQKVLSDLDLDIQAGEFVAIVGRSGCGKSTLLRLIAQLEQPSHGTVAFPQSNADSTVSHAAKLRVMFQDARLLPWKSVLQNVQLGLAQSEHQSARQILDRVGLSAFAMQWPTLLSGGQRQRVALARALAHRPELLLLDEPLGALDALTRLEMQALIEQLWTEHDFTAVLVTHDITEAVQLADRVILLENGHISAEFRVNLQRPRKKNAEFAEIEQKILEAVLSKR